MKKFLYFLFCLVFLSGCQDESISMPESTNENKGGEMPLQSGMQRLVVGSREEVKSIIDYIGDPDSPRSRKLGSLDLEYSKNEEEFVSLVDANYRHVMSQLTVEQVDSLENDEDELSFYPNDTIIADIRFAQLLNANREIQVGDTVYRYLPNGIAYTYASNAEALQHIEEEIGVTNEPVTSDAPSILHNGVIIRPYNFKETRFIDDMAIVDGSGGSSPVVNNGPQEKTAFLTDRGIQLSDGTYIREQDIRRVDYNSKGDGNIFHYGVGKLFGRNIVAIIHFSKKKKLTMNFYDQDYYIYSNIGTKLKMQKLVCGIWWNIKAEEMIQGWDKVEVEYTMEGNATPRFINPFTGINELPRTAYAPDGLGKKNMLLFRVPYFNWAVTTRDIGKALKSKIQEFVKKADERERAKINNDMEKAGLISFDNQYSYVFYGPHSEWYKDKRSVETKFYSKWFSGHVEFSFAYNGKLKFSKFPDLKQDKVALHRGTVYGAIKYNGVWKAAIISTEQ